MGGRTGWGVCRQQQAVPDEAGQVSEAVRLGGGRDSGWDLELPGKERGKGWEGRSRTVGGAYPDPAPRGFPTLPWRAGPGQGPRRGTCSRLGRQAAGPVSAASPEGWCRWCASAVPLGASHVWKGNSAGTRVWRPDSNFLPQRLKSSCALCARPLAWGGGTLPGLAALGSAAPHPSLRLVLRTPDPSPGLPRGPVAFPSSAGQAPALRYHLRGSLCSCPLCGIGRCLGNECSEQEHGTPIPSPEQAWGRSWPQETRLAAKLTASLQDGFPPPPGPEQFLSI